MVLKALYSFAGDEAPHSLQIAASDLLVRFVCAVLVVCGYTQRTGEDGWCPSLSLSLFSLPQDKVSH